MDADRGRRGEMGRRGGKSLSGGPFLSASQKRAHWLKPLPLEVHRFLPGNQSGEVPEKAFKREKFETGLRKNSRRNGKWELVWEHPHYWCLHSSSVLLGRVGGGGGVGQSVLRKQCPRGLTGAVERKIS